MSSSVWSAPMLRIVSGPTAGRIYPLKRTQTRIGRLPTNDIVLSPRIVSKWHALIEREAGEFILKDDRSRAGVVVEDRKITGPVRLRDGMRFKICEFVFEFNLPSEPSREPEGGTVVVASRDGTSHLAARPSPRPEEKLQAILEISRDLGRALRTDDVLDRALASLFRIFPQAARGLIIEGDDTDREPVPRMVRTRDGVDSRPAISKSVLDTVIKQRQAILCLDAIGEFPSGSSLVVHQLRSLICAPLLDSAQQPLGAIQLDVGGGPGSFNESDLDVLVAVAGLVGIAWENAKLHKAAVHEVEYEKELEFARTILESILPERRFEVAGYESWFCYEPARRVGGDYLGCFPVLAGDQPRDPAGGRVVVAVGDVSGKGLPAAMFLSRLSAEVRLVLQNEADPAQILERLNRHLLSTSASEMYVTFVAALIDAEAHTLTTAVAGHLPPLVRRARTGRVERIGEAERGGVLGQFDEETYRTATTVIEPGDVVAICTDGIWEALNRANVQFGAPAVEQVLESCAGTARSAGESLLAAVLRHVGDEPQSDDRTLFCVSRNA